MRCDRSLTVAALIVAALIVAALIVAALIVDRSTGTTAELAIVLHGNAHYHEGMRTVWWCVRSCLIAAMALSVWFSLTGCREAGEPIRPLPPDGAELPILRQVTGAHSHETRALQLVIRDAATLSQVPLVDVPVDFADEMLLVVTLGRVPSDQYRVRIDRIWRQGHRLRVATSVEYPATGAPARMASPYCIAVVPRCDLNVLNFDAEPPKRVRPWHQSTPPSRW